MSRLLHEEASWENYSASNINYCFYATSKDGLELEPSDQKVELGIIKSNFQAVEHKKELETYPYLDLRLAMN